MKEGKSNKVVILVAVGAGCCFILVVLAAILFGGAFLFGVAPVIQSDDVVETTNPSKAQAAQCRQALAIQDSVVIDVEWYSFRQGFQDNFLECQIRVMTDSANNVFDETIVDPTVEEQQEVASGKYLILTIENPEPDVLLIYGKWYERK